MSAPSACPCRFCDETFTPAGITNHQTHCDENPNPGVPVEKQKELGLLEDSSNEGKPTPDPDPDQRVASDGGLPTREVLPDGNNDGGASTDSSASEAPSQCPGCSSSETMPAHEARRQYQKHLETVPSALLATFDACERYCNECFAVYGGELGEPWRITEGLA